jgi:MFS family permease
MDLLGRIRDEMAFEGNIWKSYLYRFLMRCELWLPIWVVYLQKQRGLSLTQITLLDIPFFLLVVAAEVPTGAVADRFGRRVSLVLGSMMIAIAFFVFGIADNYVIILISWTAWGFGQTFQSGADTAILYDSLKQIGREDDFQKINGRMWALTSTAALIAILIGAPIAAATSYTVPIFLSVGIALSAIPVAISMHEPRAQHDESRDHYFQTLVAGLRTAWDQPTLRYVILYSGLITAATFSPMVFQQPFLDHHHVGTGSLGLWQAPVRGFGIVAALGAHHVLSRSGYRASFFALPVTIALCAFALAGIDHAYAFMAFLGMGLVAGIQNPMLATYINKRIPSERRATILSVQGVAGSFMLAGSQPVAGVIADQFGLRALFFVFGAATIILAPIVLVLWTRAEDEEQSELDELNQELYGRDRKTDAVAISS